MTRRSNTARLAGAVYIIVILTGIFSIAYVPSQLIYPLDAGKTVNQISASTQLFRLGIASSMICYLAFTVLPMVLYSLLHSVQEGFAKYMVIFAIISVPISFLNLQHLFEVLNLIENRAIFNAGQLTEHVMRALQNHRNGLLISQIFWGLWLFPFGYLVYRSNFLPKVLGIFLVLGSLTYVVKVFCRILIPEFENLPYVGYLTLPASIGEIGIALWLLAFGVREPFKNKGYL